MPINPEEASTIRVGQLAPAVWSMSDLLPHEVANILNKGSVQDLADLIKDYVGTASSLAFNPTTVNDGGNLPPTTSSEWLLVGKGTFNNVGGLPAITTTEELNALTSNGTYWSLAVQIPINVELAGIVQTIRSGFTTSAPSENAVFDALALKANAEDIPDISGKENTYNKQNSLVTDGSGVKFPTVDAVNDAVDILNAIIDLKLNISDYNDHFRGKYTSLALLQAAIPVGNDGDYAIVDNGIGLTAKEYIWDADEGWIESSAAAASTTDSLPEGSSNLYFTTARVLATVLTGLSFATGGAIVSTDSVLVAFGKIQKQLTDGFTGSNIRSLLGISTLSGSNTGDETTATLKTKIDVELGYALSDEISSLTVGNLISFRMPYAMTLSEVRISVNDAPTVSTIIVDVKEAGVSIFSTLVSIDAGELTSVTAAVPAVISDSSLADDALITVSTTQIGSGNTGKGLKLLLKGKKT